MLQPDTWYKENTLKIWSNAILDFQRHPVDKNQGLEEEGEQKRQDELPPRGQQLQTNNKRQTAAWWRAAAAERLTEQRLSGLVAGRRPHRRPLRSGAHHRQVLKQDSKIVAKKA